MKAVVFDNFGEPSEVLQVRDLPKPRPGPGEVLVRMIASPVNPSDLLVVRGRYVVLPKPPATPGFEGVGIVEDAGPGLIGRFVLGKRVTVINGNGGNWAEYAVIPARQARPVPSDIPDEQVASFFVNPMTVLALVRYVLAVPRGEWLLNTAAGSALGKMIIRLCKHDGIRTINVVRRHEAMAELQALGGDAVICSADGPIDEQVRKLTAGAGVKYALDPVGGETGSQVFDALAKHGRLIIYGSLTNEAIRIDPRRLIGGRQTLQGFWLSYWMRERSIPRSLALFREIGRLMKAGVFTTEVSGNYPLESIKEAVEAADATAKSGKILLRISGS